jgi:hypothetical protein
MLLMLDQIGDGSFSSLARNKLDSDEIAYETLRSTAASDIAAILWEDCCALHFSGLTIPPQYDGASSSTAASPLQLQGNCTPQQPPETTRLPWPALWPLVLQHFYQCTRSNGHNRILTDKEKTFLAHNEKAWSSTTFPRLTSLSSSSPTSSTPAEAKQRGDTTHICSAPTSSSGTVSIEEFEKFMNWLHPLAVGLHLVDEWDKVAPAPTCIHLIDKEEAANILRSSRSEEVSFFCAINTRFFMERNPTTSYATIHDDDQHQQSYWVLRPTNRFHISVKVSCV